MSARGPLAGKVVLDLTTALAGPYATLLLAGLGARVIKIENPHTGGDSSRNNSPYLTAEGLSTRRASADDLSVSMMLRGRNKRSVALDLKTPAGLAVLRELVPNADILVENFSPGVTERLGIDYPTVQPLNPRLVYASISGFGSSGPGQGAKAMDTIVQALSGVMMTAGEPGDAPVRFGLPIGDLMAPLFAVIGTLAAVVEVERGGTGQRVDVSMLGALTSLVACEPFDAFEALGMPTRTGAHVPRLAPFGTFEARDGWVALCGPTDAFAAGVFRALGRPELGSDPRFASRDARVAHAGELHGIIGDWMRGLTRDEAVAALDAEGVPAAPVRTTGEAVRDPQVLARDEIVQLRHPAYEHVGELYGSGLPIRFSAGETRLDEPAPGLGEHTEAVLRELLGYDDVRLDGLRRDGAL